MIIIIIIIHHELDVDRTVAASLTVSSKVYQVAYVHFVYYSALFWHPVVVHTC